MKQQSSRTSRQRPTYTCPRFASQRLNFECLENRRVMYGDVTAQVMNGNLEIAGDYLWNDIVLKGTGVPGEVVVESGGLDPQIQPDADVVGPTTRVNGRLGRETFRGIDNIRIDMRETEDYLSIDNLLVEGDLTIDMGSGADHLQLGQTSFLIGTVGVNGDLVVNVGHNGGSVVLQRVYVSGDIVVHGHQGLLPDAP